MKKPYDKISPSKRNAIDRAVRKVVRGRGGKSKWTSKEIAMLRELYRTTDISVIALKLKRPVGNVAVKAKLLGLDPEDVT